MYERRKIQIYLFNNKQYKKLLGASIFEYQKKKRKKFEKKRLNNKTVEVLAVNKILIII